MTVHYKPSIILLSIIVLAAFAIRISYLNALKTHPLPILANHADEFDQSRFMNLADKISAGKWEEAGKSFFSPVYSILISLIFYFFGHDFYNVFLFQSIIACLSIITVYKTAELVYNNPRIGIIAAFLMAFYGPLIYHDSKIERGALIAYLNLTSFYFLVKFLQFKNKIFLVLSGFVTGLSFIMRDNFLPFVVLPYLFINVDKNFKDRILSCVLFLSILAIPIGSLIILQKTSENKGIFTTQGSSVFWIGNTPDAMGIGLYRSPIREVYDQKTEGKALKTIGLFLNEVVHNPSVYSRLYWRKIQMYFNGYEIPGNLSFDLFREDIKILRIGFVTFTFICPLALMAMLIGWKKFAYHRLLVLFTFVLSMSVIAFHIQGRYRIPSIPFFILLAAFTIEWFIQKLGNKQTLKLIIGSVVFLLLFNFCSPNERIIKTYFGDKVRPLDYVNTAIAYHYLLLTYPERYPSSQKAIIYQKVIEYFSKAIESTPGTAKNFRTDLYINKGLFEKLTGQENAAEKSFQEALSLNKGKEDTIWTNIKERWRVLSISPQDTQYVYF
ncbi:MAG: glycosyltransferase family 39 protein [Candidatus Omnitrophica bacterium]|nr:glycosyltransferase family 39 protein [Candidatus Omnitrophota bacterium]